MKYLSMLLSILFIAYMQTANAAEPKPQVSRTAMTNQHLDALIKRIDKDAEGGGGYWKLDYEGNKVLIITDEAADRMRIIAAVTNSAELSQSQLYRLMQANFDSALDARYAIAKGVIWSAYIHPLASLEEREFFSALAQVITLRSTYGSSFSSGGLVFQGGDNASNKQHREIMRKGLSF